MHVTLRKSGYDFGHELDQGIKNGMKSKGLKVNLKHFSDKCMKIDDIDVEAIGRPMRSSTPTPSISGSTILAGHLDYSLDAFDDLDSTLHTQEKSADSDENDSERDEFFNQYLPPSQRKQLAAKPKAVIKETASDHDSKTTIPNKNNYCEDWMKKEQGVSTTNSNAPPSLYNASIALSDSLLDITSVSRNDPNLATTKGRGFKTSKDYSNVNFM